MATCESCGAEEAGLRAVHRMYLTPPVGATPGSEQTLEEIEHWCYACRVHYPHQSVD